MYLKGISPFKYIIRYRNKNVNTLFTVIAQTAKILREQHKNRHSQQKPCRKFVLNYNHTIAKGKEPIPLLYRGLVRGEGLFPSEERAHEHYKRAFG